MRLKILKIRYYWKEIIFCFILLENISNIWNSMMSIWYEKTKSIWTDRINIISFIRIFKKNGVVPAVTKEQLDKFLQQHPEITNIFIDWTERQIQRNSDYEKQKKDYSGKKKKHTMKNIVLTWDNKLIIWLSKTYWGSKHDYAILKKTWFMEVLVGYVVWVDSWFYWIKKDYPNNNIMIPYKNSKLNKLSDEQKEDNHIISSIRVIIENIIWWAKKYWIITNRYRNRTRWSFKTVKNNRKQLVMMIVCWLYNLWKIW